MSSTAELLDDPAVVDRILRHIDCETTDRSESPWREPVEHYRSAERLAAEIAAMRGYPIPFCPTAALAEAGSYVAREAAGTPLLAVRGSDGVVRVFRNACRHRGMQLASGAGCQRAFVCRYHGWTYALDGRLRHVPHEQGFPDLDKGARGLVEVESAERQGVVFATPCAPAPGPERSGRLDPRLAALPPLIPLAYRFCGTQEQEIPANWKILVEGFLEGYHIRSTHSRTFYPVQYDNLNVVERFGPNSRVAFPYRAIEKLRGVPPARRSAEGKLTYVYHLFPSAVVATFPGRIIMATLEPLETGLTRQTTYLLSDRDEGDAASEENLARGGELVAAGAAEDLEVACAIQRGLASGANEFFEFGLFEGAIGHFHRTLRALLGEPA